MNRGLNGIGAGLRVDPNPMHHIGGGEVQFLHQSGGTRHLAEDSGLHNSAAAAADFDLNSDLEGANTKFEPDLDNSSFDPFNNDQFDAFHLSDLNYNNAADWINDSAF